MPTSYARFSAAITAEISLCGGRQQRVRQLSYNGCDGRRTRC